MPYEPPPELAGLSLAQVAELVATRKLPPLDEWAPATQGDSGMRITADGRWLHDGEEIRRPAMVRAFATLLQRDAAGRHWLVTPHEALAIEVEDAAFVAVDVKREDGALAFRLNTDEFVIAGPDHRLAARGSMERPAIYLGVRHGTEARLNRSTWAQLAGIALEEHAGRADGLSLVSQGVSFALEPR